MKIFRAVEKGLEIPENLEDLPDEVDNLLPTRQQWKIQKG